ncbi:MAG: RecX family transcriptional regulator [Spirochaetes bacterium]|nr:RecX family transcriptional regulator [Spirochaetota bacterium]
MLEITAIKYAENYVKIIFDAGEHLILSPEVSGMYKLRKGKSVDASEYQQLKEESDRFMCARKAIDYLSASDRSGLEIETHLNKKGFSRDIVSETMKKLSESGYLDDYKFALNYVRYQKRKKAVGENLLRRDLFRKGVSKKIINKTLTELRSDNSDFKSLYQLALKKIRLLKNKKNVESKLVFFLKQRGYLDNEIRAIIDRLKHEGYIDEPAQEIL